MPTQQDCEGCGYELNDCKCPKSPPPKAPGDKFDAGKLQPRLLPIGPLKEIVGVLTFGLGKYSADNWKHVEQPIDRYTNALLRHVFAYMDGEENDPESGLPHLAHAGCCLLFLLWFEGAE